MNQILFIRKQGAQLRKEGNSMVVFHQGKRNGIFPLENVDAMILMGPVEISSAMIKYAVKNKIHILWTDSHGILKAMIKSPSSRNIVVRMLQYKSWLNKEKKLHIARECVKSKIENHLTLVKKLNSPILAELKTPAKNALDSLNQVESVEQVRGIEGGFAAVYFRFFPGLLINSFGFKKRTKRPPKDPVNAMLSFGYTLLFLNIFSILEARGMDPYIGYLHDLRYSHPALASDLIEPFRFIIDKAVVDLINHEIISLNHFEKAEGITMTADGLKIFMEKIREILNTPLQWSDGEKRSVIKRLDDVTVALVRYLGDKERSFNLAVWK